MLLGGTAAVSLVAMGMATAGESADSPASARADATARAIAQMNQLEQRAAAAGDTRAVLALNKAELALQSRQASAADSKRRPSNPPPRCPSSAPRGGSPQPCGQANGHSKPTPTPTATASASPRPTATGTATPASCGPASAGGTPAAGPISGPLYEIGAEISANGGEPIGDAVQEIACAVYENLEL